MRTKGKQEKVDKAVEAKAEAAMAKVRAELESLKEDAPPPRALKNKARPSEVDDRPEPQGMKHTSKAGEKFMRMNAELSMSKSDAPIMEFRLLNGTHWEGRRQFSAGAVIKSQRDLSSLFLNKFECLSPRRDNASPVLAGARVVQDGGGFNFVAAGNVAINDYPLYDDTVQDLEDTSEREHRIIPRLWRDGTVYVLGGGHSLRPDDLGDLAGYNKVIGANHTAYLLNTPIMFFCDPQVQSNYPDELAKYGGWRVTTHDSFLGRKGYHVVRSSPDTLSEVNSAISTNRNSGIGALSLAWLLGAKRAVLVGFDMKEVNGRFHWYADSDKTRWPRDVCQRHVKAFEAFAGRAKVVGFELFGTSKDSALSDIIPTVDLKEALAWRHE